MMSLTSNLANPIVKAFFKKTFPFPDDLKFNTDNLTDNPTINMPNSVIKPNYQLLGVAIDYLLRYQIYFNNHNTVNLRQPVFLTSFDLLKNYPWEMFKNIVKVEKICYGEKYTTLEHQQNITVIENLLIVFDQLFVQKTINEKFISVVWKLSRLDCLYRAGLFDPLVLSEHEDIEYIKHLQDLLINNQSIINKITTDVYLNPVFKDSPLVGGADCDLIYNNALIDIKTTIHPTKNIGINFYQILGYYFLSHHGLMIGDDMKKPVNININTIGFWLPRQAWLSVIDVKKYFKTNNINEVAVRNDFFKIIKLIQK